MASRIVIEEPCIHGLVTGPHEFNPDCPGGSRRVLTEGEYVLIEKVEGRNGSIWPEWAYEIWDKWFHDKDEPGATTLFDALAGGES